MNTDVFFTQGSTHKICQDYAISNRRDKDGNILGPAFVVVCDGCSGAEDSDFGARLLARAAVKYNDRFLTNDQRLNRILATADMYRQSLSLPIQSLCATLLTAVETTHNIEVSIVGDGVVYARRRDGTAVIYEYRYPFGAPYYLRYSLSQQDEEEYGKKFGWCRITVVYAITGEETKIVRSELNNGRPSDGLPALSCMPAFRTFDKSIFDLVAIMSDGASAFERFNETNTGREPVSIPMADVLKEMTSFKNYNGEFVQRRCQKALKQCRANGWQNMDDFSIGAIYVGAES